MSQAADSFSKSGMQELLDPLRQEVTTQLTKAENTVRTALGTTRTALGTTTTALGTTT